MKMMEFQIGTELKLGFRVTPEEVGFKRLDFGGVRCLSRFMPIWIWNDQNRTTLVKVMISFVDRFTGGGIPDISWESHGGKSGLLQFLESSGWQDVFIMQVGEIKLVEWYKKHSDSFRFVEGVI